MEDECQICCNPIKFYSIAACDHPIFCNVCALRLRILKKDLRCALCQIESPNVIFSSSKHAYSSFKLTQLKHDSKLGIYFDSKSTGQESISILQYHCIISECPSRNLSGLPHLISHLLKKHKLLTCELCIEHKHIFPSEIETFTSKTDLARHKSKGENAFKGHTFCQHCNEYFYDKDALYTHVRSRHEVCFLCARDGYPEQIYDNYTTLEYHFNNDHYACREPSCLEKKFVAFGSDIDLQGHIVREHSNSKGKSKGRAVNIEFNYVSAFPSHFRGPRNRESDSEPRSSSHRRFNSQLTVEPEFSPEIKAQVRSSIPSTNNFGNSFPRLDSVAPNQEILLTPAQSDVFFPAGPDFALLVQKLIGKDFNSLAKLKIAFHSFKYGSSSAEQLLLDFISLIDFGNPARKKSIALMTETQSVWHRMADLLPEEPSDEQTQRALDKRARKKGLSLEEFEALRRGEPKKSIFLRVWNDYKVKIQQSEQISSLALMKKSSWAALDPDPKLKKNLSSRVMKVIDKKENVVGSSRGASPTLTVDAGGSSTISPKLNELSIRTQEFIAPVSQIVISDGLPLNRSQESFPTLPVAKRPDRVSVTRKSNLNHHAWTGSDAPATKKREEDSSVLSKKGKAKKKVLLKFG